MRNKRLLLTVIILSILLATTLIYYESGVGYSQQFAHQCSVIGRPFESPNALREWLENDPTSEQDFVFMRHDCDDFAVELVEAAQRDGYQMGLLIIYRKYKQTTHLKCWTAIGDVVYIVSAEQDAITPWAYQPNVFENNWVLISDID